MNILPQDITRHIALLSEYTDLSNLLVSAKDFYKLNSDTYFWSLKIIRDFSHWESSSLSKEVVQLLTRQEIDGLDAYNLVLLIMGEYGDKPLPFTRVIKTIVRLNQASMIEFLGDGQYIIKTLANRLNNIVQTIRCSISDQNYNVLHRIFTVLEKFLYIDLKLKSIRLDHESAGKQLQNDILIASFPYIVDWVKSPINSYFEIVEQIMSVFMPLGVEMIKDWKTHYYYPVVMIDNQLLIIRREILKMAAYFNKWWIIDEYRSPEEDNLHEFRDLIRGAIAGKNIGLLIKLIDCYEFTTTCYIGILKDAAFVATRNSQGEVLRAILDKSHPCRNYIPTLKKASKNQEIDKLLDEYGIF